MRVVRLCAFAAIFLASGLGATAIERVNPLEALERSRREGIEFDRRMSRYKAEQQKREREEEARRKRLEAEQKKREKDAKVLREAQRERDAAAARSGQSIPSAPTPILPNPRPGALTPGGPAGQP